MRYPSLTRLPATVRELAAVVLLATLVVAALAAAVLTVRVADGPLALPGGVIAVVAVVRLFRRPVGVGVGRLVDSL